ncbi:MAG: cache and HAMP domain-containing protein, partial [Magnetovibrio sp.]|nr:cache and HAMP domain-containing protein [Magnetovibrio sp.]
MNLTISKKLPIVIVILAAMPVIISGIIAFFQTQSALHVAAFERLSAVQKSRAHELSGYLYTIHGDLDVLTSSSSVIDALEQFEGAWVEMAAQGTDMTQYLQKVFISDNPNPIGEKLNLTAATDGSAYSAVHKKWHPWFTKLLLDRDYFDIFLLDDKGNVVYSVLKELDYATNLKTGKWKDSDLAKVGKMVRQNMKLGYTAFTDYSPYAPSDNVPASFMAMPIFDHQGETHGTLVFQMPVAKINDIMQQSGGMGESGQSYLVGQDMTMRSDSRFLAKGETSILSQDVATDSVKKALNGETGIAIVDNYRGIPVVSAYGALDFLGVTWAVIAEVDDAEVNIPVIELRNEMIVIILATIAVVSVIGYFFAMSITKPISAMTGVMGVLANKDWTADVPSQNRTDEIGKMASAVQIFKTNGQEVERLESEQKANEARTIQEKRQQMLDMADDFESSVGGVVQSVSSASTEMQSSASTLSATAE